MVRLTERYCVVYQTLRQPTPIAVARTRAIAEPSGEPRRS